jgi:glycosyltransferase involved in cell wall biosynthesis
MISVIMSTYKEDESQLRQSIESILNQTYQNFEFIIILDNPENEMHRSVIHDYAAKDSRIRFYPNEKNMGLARSLNRGLELANGEYIARMDADDVSLPNRFEKQLDYLKTNCFDLIGGLTEVIDENGNILYKINKVPSHPDKIKKCLRYGQVVAHPTWFGKKDMFDDLHGYRLIPLCEDTDFVLRAVLKGYKMSNINESVLKYRMSSNSVSRSNLYEQYLYLCFITDAYKQGKVANIADAMDYVQSHNNEKIAKKYSESNVLFNQMLKEMRTKQVIPFIGHGFELLFHSRPFLDRIRRFALLSMNS